MTPWYEPVDDFAFPIGSSPAGWFYRLGCKHCRGVSEVPSRRYNELDDGTYDRVDIQAFRCDHCRHWLTIRQNAPIFPGTDYGARRLLEAQHG